MPDRMHLTERQAKWFESVRSGLERDTGRTLDQWSQLARACPEHAHRARLAWIKDHYGLGQNHASLVLNAAFPPATSWSKPELLEQALWKDPQSANLCKVLKDLVGTLPDVVIGQRKSFTAFSRKVQFAAARPLKSHGMVLGLAISPETGGCLVMPGRESWSERLKSVVEITTPTQINEDLLNLIRQAWERS